MGGGWIVPERQENEPFPRVWDPYWGFCPVAVRYRAHFLNKANAHNVRMLAQAFARFWGISCISAGPFGTNHYHTMADVPSWLPVRLATLEKTLKAHSVCMMRIAGAGFATPAAILARIEHFELELLKLKQFMAAAEVASAMAATSAMAVDAADAADAAVPEDVSEDEAVAEDVSEDEAFDATLGSASLPVEVDWTDFTAMAITGSGRSSAAIADTEAESAVAIAAEAAKQLAVIAAAEQHFADMAANAQELIEADARMAAITQQIKAVEGIKTTGAAKAAMTGATAAAAEPMWALDDAVMADEALDAVMADAAAASAVRPW